MSKCRAVLAFDLGASSGRCIKGTLENGKLELEEISRFQNVPIYDGEKIFWDVKMIFNEIKRAMKIAGEFESVGIDTWGVDFGIIGENGKLIKDCVNYRDPRTNDVVKEFEKLISKDDLYMMSGIQIMQFNTIFQLFCEMNNGNGDLEKGKNILLMPDLLNYLLTGKAYGEMSICSTTGLMDLEKRKWNSELIKKMNLNEGLFPEIIHSGTIVGNVTEEICKELNISDKKVIAICEHDTASAVAAVPAEEDFVFISCGTWALFGTEIEKPIITKKSLDYNLTNELGINGTTTFLKNIIGLWLIQETKKYFEKQGRKYSFFELEELAKKAKPFKCFIDPVDEVFLAPFDIPERIKKFAETTGQEIPESDGEIVRCINESLAFMYRYTYEQITESVQKEFAQINMIGGGTQSKMLCHFTACATGKKVVAGPIEGSSIGNMLVQFIALEKIKDIKEGRKIVMDSFETITYEPTENWDLEYARFRKVIGR